MEQRFTVDVDPSALLTEPARCHKQRGGDISRHWPATVARCYFSTAAGVEMMLSGCEIQESERQRRGTIGTVIYQVGERGRTAAASAHRNQIPPLRPAATGEERAGARCQGHVRAL